MLQKFRVNRKAKRLIWKKFTIVLMEVTACNFNFRIKDQIKQAAQSTFQNVAISALRTSNLTQIS
jgi:hypothetical protein